MPLLNASNIILDDRVRIGPANVVLVDKTDIESDLREEPTTAWKKGWSERSYDFPNLYITEPTRFLTTKPISTFADDQNTRFIQRYVNTENASTFNR